MKSLLSTFKEEENFIFVWLSEHKSNINFTFLVGDLEPQVKCFELISVLV